MNPILLYMLKASLCIAVFYLFYLLFLGRDTMYERNRIFILLSFLSAMILPLINIQTKQPLDIQFFGRDLTELMIGEETGILPATTADTALFDWKQIAFMVYLSGVFLLSLKLLAEIISLLLLIRKQKSNGSRIIRLKNHNSSGFSAFGYIFIYSGLNPEEVREIVKHEQKHLNQHHFFDLLFVEILKVLQWFNPFIYLFDRSLRAVHEFQADEECLNSGVPVQSYQGLMLNQVFRSKVFTAVNSFSNPTLIKKRMIMMTKRRSGALADLKIILVLPVLVFLLFSFSTCVKKSFDTFTGTGGPTPTEALAPPPLEVAIPSAPVKDGEAFVIVEEMPKFPGGDTALLRYIFENTTYPAEAKENNIQGRVVVRFKIREDGKVSDASVLKGVDPSLDAEALRVVSSLPQFTPGKVDGVPVPVWYMVPITFALSGKPAVPPPPPPAKSIRDATYENVEVVMERPAGTRKSTEPFVIVEEMPMFPGGDSALLAYVWQNTRYPETSKANNIMGKVIVRFCVTETGAIDKISVLKSVDPDLDAEAMRVASTLPAFEPGKQGGVPVPVWYMIPITFTLK